MKRVWSLLLFCVMLCSIVTTAFAAVKANNYVWYLETGAYSSRSGSYVQKTNSKTTWSFCAMFAQKGPGAWGSKPYSTAGYLYSRETADRVSNVATSDILASHGYSLPASKEAAAVQGGDWQYAKASYAVKGRTYKTVIKVSTGNGSGNSGNWEVHMYTTP